jgi:hypothetical protein
LLPIGLESNSKENPKPKGYGSNQNAVFGNFPSPFFCVLNPDICFKENPFPELLANFSKPKVTLGQFEKFWVLNFGIAAKAHFKKSAILLWAV